MKKLLSLPPNLVDCFHDITGHSYDEWFCTNDPVGHKLGSGGGTTWLLEQAYSQMLNSRLTLHASFKEWLSKEKRILLHAGGQSRRLPSYAPSGKILTPIPVFRWERGQRLSQDLLSLQIPLYEQIMQAAPAHLHTMVVSGDVYIRSTEMSAIGPQLAGLDADVVCYGLWLDSSIAKDHGVFVSSRQHPQQLKCMLQKPTVETLSKLLTNHFYLTDIGIWLLSDHAVEILMQKSHGSANSSQLNYYDLYSDFGCALGTEPSVDDPEVGALRVAVLPLPGGEFYHFGTSHELLSSTLAVQNLVNDQRRLLHRDRKPHPSIFVQNAETQIAFTPENQNVWIENAYVGENWSITHEHIITGVPENNWQVSLKPGQCLDVIPIGEEQYCIRPYGYHDRFAGEEQQRKQFPVVDAAIFKESKVFNDINEMKTIESCCLLSAEEISAKANLRRLTEQRRLFRAKNWPCLAKNYKHSVFYQIDLEDAAREFAMNRLPVPAELPESEPLLTRIHDAMFRSELARNAGGDTNAGEQKAFSLLREGLTMTALIEKQQPRLSVYSDQIVWGRSPVRIDLAGGWTDTPPYCLMEGGRVLNIAIELNGQPPLQTYVKPCKEHHIVLRSIDLGASEVVKTYEELADFNHVGSPFSIPKAALVLAGFQPGFSQEQFDTLEHQLQAFGCGIEVTLLSAIPAGSGLGTSSLLASTVLGALNDFCGLMWDKNEIGRRTLVLEQLLTTGGGWQDQYGGLLHGVKLLETGRGFEQLPSVRWLPTSIYTQPEYQQCHLLYYTGITRTAKNILSEIVRRMFLNQHDELAILRAMKAHAQEMYEVIQREDFEQMGRLVGKTWLQNQSIDNGTNPPKIQALTELVDDLCLGYKLPGAGGGGYLYMVAKDPEAAARIRHILNSNRKLLNERFVDMSLSMNGLQVSRS